MAECEQTENCVDDNFHKVQLVETFHTPKRIFVKRGDENNARRAAQHNSTKHNSHFAHDHDILRFVIALGSGIGDGRDANADEDNEQAKNHRGKVARARPAAVRSTWLLHSGKNGYWLCPSPPILYRWGSMARHYCWWWFPLLVALILFTFALRQEQEELLTPVPSPQRQNHTFFIVPGGWTDISPSMYSCGCKLVTEQQRASVLVWFPPNGSPKPVKLPHQKLAVWSREPKAFAPNPWEEQTADLAMTYNLDSNVPISYMPREFVKTIWSLPIPSQQDFDGRRTAIWLSSQCTQMTWPRMRVIEELQKYITIDCLGGCLNNGPRLTENGVKAASRYKFWIGLEKMLDGDYVTEKLMTAYLGNTVPVYAGTSQSIMFVPSKSSYIDIFSFSNVHELGLYLSNITTNYTQWVDHFNWRMRPPRKELIELEKTSQENEPLCRLCSFLQTNPNYTYSAGVGALPNKNRFDEVFLIQT